MQTACHILGWVLCGIAAALATFLIRLARDRPKQSMFKTLDRDIMRGALGILGLLATIGILIIIFTWPGT